MHLPTIAILTPGMRGAIADALEEEARALTMKALVSDDQERERWYRAMERCAGAGVPVETLEYLASTNPPGGFGTAPHSV